MCQGRPYYLIIHCYLQLFHHNTFPNCLQVSSYRRMNSPQLKRIAFSPYLYNYRFPNFWIHHNTIGFWCLSIYHSHYNRFIAPTVYNTSHHWGIHLHLHNPLPRHTGLMASLKGLSYNIPQLSPQLSFSPWFHSLFRLYSFSLRLVPHRDHQ